MRTALEQAARLLECDRTAPDDQATAAVEVEARHVVALVHP
jgi:hypothetical protein